MLYAAAPRGVYCLICTFRGSQEGARGVFRHFVMGAQGTLRCRIYAETRAKAPPGIYPEGALRRVRDSNPMPVYPRNYAVFAKRYDLFMT